MNHAEHKQGNSTANTFRKSHLSLSANTIKNTSVASQFPRIPSNHKTHNINTPKPTRAQQLPATLKRKLILDDGADILLLNTITNQQL